MAKVKRLFKFHKSTTDEADKMAASSEKADQTGTGGIKRGHKRGKSPTFKQLSEWNKNDDKLLKAVERGDVGKVDSLLNKKTLLPTKPGPKGLSVFHLAAGSGQLPIVERFLAYGVDVNSTDLLGRTALHLAAKLGWPQMVEKLLQMGANQNAHDSDHMSAVHYACGSCHLPCVQSLIQHGAYVNGKDKSGRSPLFYCAQSGDLPMCKLLVDHGADVNMQDHCGRTALIFAAGKGHRGVCELLLRRGANAECRDQEGLKAVEYSIKAGHTGLQEVFDRAPARASWDVAGGASDTGNAQGSAENSDLVNRFSAENSPTVSAKQSAMVSSSAPSTTTSPHSGEATPSSSPTTDQKTLDAYKELEEEHELLTEELRTLRVAHIRLQDKLQFLTQNSSGEQGSGDNKRMQVMENELKKVKHLYTVELEKNNRLEAKMEKLELQVKSESSADSPGGVDSWGDSDDELFGNPAEKKRKSGAVSEDQLVAMLRSQILTLRQENEDLREKAQMDSGQNSPVTRQIDQGLHSEYVDSDLTNGTVDINSLQKEKMDLLHEIETLKEEAASLRQSPLTQSVSVFSEGESGIHMNGERSRTPSEEGDLLPSGSGDETSGQDENRLLKETVKKMQVAYSALVEAGDKLQVEYDQQYDEKTALERKLQEVVKEKEELSKENDILAADNLHEDFERLFSELETLQEKNKKLQKEKEELSKRPLNLTIGQDLQSSGELSRVTDERDSLKVKCAELEETASQLKQDHDIVIEEIESLQERLSDAQTERDQFQQELDLTQDDLEKMTQQYELVQQEYNTLEQDYAELLADKRKLEQDFVHLELNRSGDASIHTISRHEQDVLVQQNSILSEEKEVLETKVLELETAKQLLEKDLESEKIKANNLQVKASNGENSSRSSPAPLSPLSTSPVPHSTEKDKQIRSLQVKISRLQQQVTEMGRKHRDTVNTYRTHLVSAVQGRMDPDVQQAIHHIIELRSTEQYC